MGIAVNASDKQVVKSKELFTGLIDYRLVAINPTQEEAEKLGRTLRKEPEYSSKDDDGVAKLRLDFYIEATSEQAKGLQTKVTFWLEDKERTSLDGTKKEVINSKGNSTWLATEDGTPPDWYDQEGLRNAYVGESPLYEFIKAWLNVDPDDACTLDTPFSKIAKGDLKELAKYLKAAPNNTFSALTGVRKDDKGNIYQEVWNGAFGRTSSFNAQFWSKQLDNPYPAIKFDYQNSLKISKYELTLDGEDAEDAEAPVAGLPGGTRF